MKLYRIFLFQLVLLLQLIFLPSSYADFVNGGFEDTYTPSGSSISDPVTGWTITGYTFNGATTVPPTSTNDLNLTASLAHPNGISDIIIGTNQTLNEYFLEGSLPTPTLLLPVTGLQTASINLRPMHAQLAKSGTGAISGWTSIGKQATAFSQTITVTSADRDPIDGVVHVRFVAAPVLENPSHAASQQPFFAIQLNNLTTGRSGSTPLFFQWNYSAQAGVPWITLTQAGTNAGSNTTYTYTDFQAYDIAPGNAYIHVGDQIELVAIASGCSLGGHDGHLYLDDVSTTIPSGLWITATGPQQTAPGNNITYTYTYTNSSGSTANGVQVVLALPQSSSPVANTTFVSVTNPTTGTSTSCTGTGPVTCNIGTLLAGQSGTFQLTVNVPSGWPTSQGPVNNGNYPISATGLSPLLGPLIQTTLVSTSALSNLVVDTGGLPTTGTVGTAYSGTFTCSNTSTATATGDATSATCDINNLPGGLSVAGCTISPSATIWIEPATIPANETVTCTVTGTPTTPGTVTGTVTADASNNSNSTTNHANVSIVISSPSGGGVDIPATVNGSSVINPAVVCCGRPVILGSLPVSGSGPTTYIVTQQTGNVTCSIGKTATQTYLQLHGKPGSCTIIGMKNGIVSNPLTVITV